MITLIETFLNTCKKHAGATAVIDQIGSATYDTIYQEAREIAAQLLVEDTGNTIGILLPAGKKFVTTFYGILIAGKTPVPLNYLLSSSQLLFVIQNADIDTVFTNSLFKPLLENHIRRIFSCEEKIPHALIGEEKIKRGDAEDLAAILYTSGTDANPKGVMLTHKNFLSNLDGCIHAFKFTDKDILLGILPLFHTYALTTTLILPTCVGATVVYLERFSGPKVLEVIEKYKITCISAIPSMYRMLVRAVTSTKHNLSSLRLCTSGGEHLPGEILAAFNEAFPVRLMEGYGLTEATAVVSVNTPEKYKPNSIGAPLDNLEVKIVGESGQCLPANKEGEIWVKGPNIMKGYYKLPKETEKTITSDGWLKTGDYGKVDAEGFLWITGRKKDLIIISGENVSPREIEQVIGEHEKVFEVAVVGVPDKVRGEVPKACIVLHEHAVCNEEEIRDHCMQRLPNYKVPKYFEFLKELPHSPTGKILKRVLR